MGKFDWGGAAGGAASGAATGAVGGPVGMGIGALLGGALGGLGGDEAKSPEEQMLDMLGTLFDYQTGPHLANQFLANIFGLTGEQSNPRIRKQMELDLRAQGYDVPKGALNPKKKAKQEIKASRLDEQLAKLQEGGITDKEQRKFDALTAKRADVQSFLDTPDLFTQASPFAQQVQDFIQQPIQFTEAEQQIADALGLTMPGAEPGTGTPGESPIDLFGDLAETGDYLRETVIPMTEDLARTGWEVDIDPIIAEEQRRFSQETVPMLAERYGMGNTGLGSYLGRASQELGTTLGTKKYDAGEAAAQRRLFGIGQLPRVATLPSIFETEGLGNILNLGQDVRGAAEATRPGSRLLTALGDLSGVSSGMGIPMMMQPPEGAGQGGVLSSLLASPNFPGMGELSGILKLG